MFITNAPRFLERKSRCERKKCLKHGKKFLYQTIVVVCFVVTQKNFGNIFKTCPITKIPFFILAPLTLGIFYFKFKKLELSRSMVLANFFLINLIVDKQPLIFLFMHKICILLYYGTGARTCMGYTDC